MLKIAEMTREQIQQKITGQKYSPEIVNKYDWWQCWPLVQNGIIVDIVYIDDNLDGVVIVNNDYASRDHIIYNGQAVLFDSVVNLMDDEIREEVHRDLSPCTNQAFFDAYSARHLEKYGEEFTID